MTARIALIHSTGLGPFMWAPYVKALSAYEPLTPFNLGYQPGGEITRPNPVSVAQEIAHLEPQLLALQAPVHLVAHSYGGMVALEIARRGRVPVKSLFMYEPVLFSSLRECASEINPAAARDVGELYANPSFFTDDSTGGNDVWLEQFIDYWNHPGAWAAMGDKPREAMRRVGWKMHLEVRIVATQARPFCDYALPAPMTVVRGQRSPETAREMARMLVAANPGATLKDLPRLGHMGVIEDPAAVLELIGQHLASCCPPAYASI